MNKHVRKHLIEKFGLDANATDEQAKALLQEKLASKELDLDTYTELLAKADSEPSPAEKLEDLFNKSAEQTASAVATQLTPVLEQVAKALTPQGPPKTDPPKDQDGDKTKGVITREELDKELVELTQKLKDSMPKPPTGDNAGTRLMKMAAEISDEDESTIRVKSVVENLGHTPTAAVYNGPKAKRMGIDGRPKMYNDREFNLPTERTRYLSAIWLKYQIHPNALTEHEREVVRYVLNREKFHVPNSTNSRLLTENERHAVEKFNSEFYDNPSHRKALIDDSTSGGEDSIPEFFDMDMIVTPTLAGENIPSFCNVRAVPRGTAAQNFIIGRPTIAAANTEGSATSLFSTTGFITNHDTSFFRAAGFIEVGRNFALDAHPGIVSEIQNQYMNSVRLWFNEQIMAGDGTTEPQGVTVASGTTDVTPATPTTGPAVLADVFDCLFGVGKAHRENGGRRNAIFVCTDTAYQRIRAIATGVTGDTRLVFGDDVESYELFNHPVLIEENGLGNNHLIFFQAQGYRLYIRQGARFIREDRGDTLVRKNTFILGVDLRAGGQLDEGAYAAVIDGLLA